MADRIDYEKFLELTEYLDQDLRIEAIKLYDIIENIYCSNFDKAQILLDSYERKQEFINNFGEHIVEIFSQLAFSEFRFDRIDILDFLLVNNLDPKIYMSKGNNLILYYAINSNNLPIIDYLLKSNLNIDLNCIDQDQIRLPLEIAISNDKTASAIFLIDNGADVTKLAPYLRSGIFYDTKLSSETDSGKIVAYYPSYTTRFIDSIYHLFGNQAASVSPYLEITDEHITHHYNLLTGQEAFAFYEHQYI